MSNEITIEQARAIVVESEKNSTDKLAAVATATAAFIANPSDTTLLTALVAAKTAADKAETVVERAKRQVVSAEYEIRATERAAELAPMEKAHSKLAMPTSPDRIVAAKDTIDGLLLAAQWRVGILTILHDANWGKLAELGVERIEAYIDPHGDNGNPTRGIKPVKPAGVGGAVRVSGGGGSRARKLYGPERLGSREYCYKYADADSVAKTQALVDDPNKSASFSHLAASTAAKLGHQIVDA